MWCLGEINSRFISQMEQVLDRYERGYDEKFPVVCFDERPCQLLDDILTPQPLEPGKVARQDYHYKRNGTCAVLLAIEPLKGRRISEVSVQKTKKDYARFMKSLSKAYPKAQKIILIQDNLNTHDASSFYENMSAKEAFKLSQRFEMIYTPKKASWLNMAEIEFSALSKQCLDRRIGDMQTMRKEVSAWVKKRNKDKVKINWEFSKEKARDKFQSKYQNIKN